MNYQPTASRLLTMTTTSIANSTASIRISTAANGSKTRRDRDLRFQDRWRHDASRRSCRKSICPRLIFQVALLATFGMALVGEPENITASEAALQEANEQSKDENQGQASRSTRLHGVANWYSSYWADDPNGKYPQNGGAARQLVDA